MAKMLYDRDSTERHLEAAKRFIRLCKRMSGTEELVAGIQPSLDQLGTRRAEAAGKAEERMYAYDALVLRDTHRDNAVRTAFERCQQSDRTSAAAPVLPSIFPGESFGDLVRTPVLEQPDAVRELVVRLESLGEKHELSAVAAELRRAADASVQAASDYRAAVRAEKEAEAEEEIAQAALRLQYERSYLRAREKFGRQGAEQLFPHLTTGEPRVEEQPAA